MPISIRVEYLPNRVRVTRDHKGFSSRGRGRRNLNQPTADHKQESGSVQVGQTVIRELPASTVACAVSRWAFNESSSWHGASVGDTGPCGNPLLGGHPPFRGCAGHEESQPSSERRLAARRSSRCASLPL